MLEQKEGRRQRGSKEDGGSGECPGPSDSKYCYLVGCTWLCICRSCQEGSTGVLG